MKRKSRNRFWRFAYLTYPNPDVDTKSLINVAINLKTYERTRSAMGVDPHMATTNTKGLNPPPFSNTPSKVLTTHLYNPALPTKHDAFPNIVVAWHVPLQQMKKQTREKTLFEFTSLCNSN